MIAKQIIDSAYDAMTGAYWDAFEQPFSLKGVKTRARDIFVAFILVGGYDLDRDPEGATQAFSDYCDACASDFSKWPAACADNWLGYLENRERMRTWQRKKSKTPEIAGKKDKEAYSC